MFSDIFTVAQKHGSGKKMSSSVICEVFIIWWIQDRLIYVFWLLSIVRHFSMLTDNSIKLCANFEQRLSFKQLAYNGFFICFCWRSVGSTSHFTFNVIYIESINLNMLTARIQQIWLCIDFQSRYARMYRENICNISPTIFEFFNIWIFRKRSSLDSHCDYLLVSFYLSLSLSTIFPMQSENDFNSIFSSDSNSKPNRFLTLLCAVKREIEFSLAS